MEESTRFANADINPTLVPTANTVIPSQSMQSSSSRANNQDTISLQLPALKDGTASAETVDSNCTQKSHEQNPLLILKLQPLYLLQFLRLIETKFPAHLKTLTVI